LIHSPVFRRLIRSALEEDIGAGDATTAAVLTGQEFGTAQAAAKADMVLAGIGVFREAFLLLDPDI